MAKPTEKALRSDPYRDTLDAMADTIHVVDRDLRILLVNARFRVWIGGFGLDTDPIGRNLFEVFPFLSETVREEYRQAFDRGQVLRTEDRNEFAGRLIITETTKIPVGEGGRIGRVVTVIRDITESRLAQERLADSESRHRALSDALRQSEAKFATAFMTNPALMAITTIEDGRIVEVNDAMLIALECRRDEVIGRSTRELGFYDEHTPREQMVRALADNGFVRNLDVTIRTRSGKQRHGIFSAHRIHLAGKPLLLSVMADVTERREAEAALKRAHDELEAKVRERTQQLQRLATELIKAEQRERERIVHILHDDLQQILVGIRFAVTALHADLASPDAKRTLADCLANLDQALGVSRSLSSDLRPPLLHEAGLAPALAWIAGEMERLFGLRVTLALAPEPDTLDSERRILVFDAVRELLFNVAKHARVKEARLDMSWSPAGDLHVTVSDKGVGFDPARIGQNALGLFTLRERMGIFGGRFLVASQAGIGTRAELALPPAGP